MRQVSCVAAILLAFTAAFTAACGDDSETPLGGGGAGGEDAGGGGQGGVGVPPTPSADWCERLMGGPASDADIAIGWSAAHASIRFFGTEPSYPVVDEALVTALSSDDPWSEEALKNYASTLGFVCALPAADSALGAASVELEGDTAVVHPGTGDLALPPGAASVVLDLRGLPESQDLPEALERAVALALASPVDQPPFSIRQHDGLTDEVYSPSLGIMNAYANSVEDVSLPPLGGDAAEDLPLVVLTSAKMAPSAARVAISLRLANRAWIAGEDLLASVGEGKWVAVGGEGIVHRDRDAADWPDTIPADVRATDPLAAASSLFDRGSPAPIEAGDNTRDPIVEIPYGFEVEPDVHDIGHTRALLVTAHGALRLFFPYFPVVGDTIDDGLVTELDNLGPTDEEGPYVERAALRRFSSYFHDSHGFAFYFGELGGASGALPILLDETSTGAVVVRASAMASFAAGDEILEVDGQPIADLVAEQETLTSASNDSSLRRNALALVTLVRADTVWHVRSAAGVEQDVDVPLEDATGAGPAVSSRTAGFLGDLGAPSLYYINLDGPAYSGTPNAANTIAAAAGATGLILDGRGYPGTIETWNIVKRILARSSMVKFRIPQVSTLETTLRPEDQPWDPLVPGTAGHFDGPVVVIVGPWTQSQAEHILMPLASTERVTFVGRQSAGANGNITGVMLPSARGLTFTGMEVRFADGSTFHGVGIEPSVEIYPTVTELAQGIDPELASAIAILNGG